MRVLLADTLQPAERALWARLLAEAGPEFDWVRDADDRSSVEAAVVANPAPGALQGWPKLRLIQSLWAGVDRLLDDATLPPGVPIARMVDPAMNAAMAETALWAVLSLQRHFFDYARQQRMAQWKPLPQRRADELRVAVLGQGEMGGTCARRLAQQGYRVTGYSLRARASAGDGVQHVHGEMALPALLAASDVVVNLLPLTAGTRGLFDARRLAMLPPGAALVNLARGGHVVEADLLDALDQGRLSHAVLDVFSTEPLPDAHPFWQHPRITVLPHAAALTDPRSAAPLAVQNLRNLVAGAPLLHRVDRARGY